MIIIKRLIILLLFINLAFVLWCEYVKADQKDAIKHLNIIMDQYNQTFDVFTDISSANNHFNMRCAIAFNDNFEGISIDESWTQNCYSGSTCIKNTFSAVNPNYWGDGIFKTVFFYLLIQYQSVIGENILMQVLI